jgi:lycopene cyclase CruA
MIAPSSLERVARAGGPELLSRLRRLDARLGPAAADRAGVGQGPRRGAAVDYDVILLGGGLSLLYAPLLAAAGLSVCVVEQHQAATAQREWNASWEELQALVRCGLLTAEQLADCVLARYKEGICRWHGGGTQRVVGVLDCAVDASALLAHAADQCHRAGVQIDSQQRCEALCFGDGGVSVHRRDGAGNASVRSARLVLDGRGAQSPYARGDLLCPTVGGVLEGVEFDPQVGDILVTTEDVVDGRQLIWEAFPGRPGQITVYLFYYAQAHRVPPQALQALYQQFFAKLSTYKPGAARMIRPTFGYIPGWSRLSPAPRSPHPRLLLVGDAAARQSPLTFCGFGALLRSLRPVSEEICRFFAEDPHNLGRGPRPDRLDDRPLHTATGALARVVASPPTDRPGTLNQVLNAAFCALEDMGQARFVALLQDRLGLADFVRFLANTRARSGDAPLYRMLCQSLGAGGIVRWSAALAQAGWRELRAANDASAASAAR